MDYPTSIDSYRAVRIESIEKETPLVKTISFRDELCNRAKAGQYIMLWIQGVDEIPLSLSAINCESLSSVTVEKIGEATTALHSKMAGETISIRGPYGNSFRLVDGSALVVGGGVGLAPLLPLLKSLAEAKCKITLIIGAKTKKEIICLKKAKKNLDSNEGHLIVTTDDGSYGIKGLATEPMKDILTKETFDAVYTCGPEPMMRQIFEIAERKGIEVQASFERIIRCSIGLCGSCVVGRFRVCKDGPIFNSAKLREVLNEFGKYKRGFNGGKIFFS